MTHDVDSFTVVNMTTTTNTTDHTPTTEQRDAIAMFQTGENLKIEAGAGAAKTTTLVMMANATERRGIYIAFNKAIVTEAQSKMPSNVTCSTAHSLAYRAIGGRYRYRLNGPRMRSDQIAKRLGLDPITVITSAGPKRLAPGYLGGLVQRAITVFCQTADLEPSHRHVPYIDGIDDPTPDGRRTFANNRDVALAIAPAMRKAWADMQDPNGSLPYGHHCYLKQYQLAGPTIGADFIMFDEAQDANPVMRAIVEAQTHAQLVYVGDSQQQIYSFTGAVNALAEIDAQVTYLTKSFRFGPEIAAVANTVLDRLGAELRIEGAGRAGEVRRLERGEADVVLSRTNAECIRAALEELRTGGRPAIVGGAREFVKFAKAADDLKAKGWTSHPELACFSSWGEVQDYVANDPNGSDLALMVRLIDEFGTDVIIEALDQCADEDDHDVTLVCSTAHKAKGREWDRVQLANDFPTGFSTSGPNKGMPCDVADEELRLLYVAATRAKLVLDTYDNPLLGGGDDDPAVTPDVPSAGPTAAEPAATAPAAAPAADDPTAAQAGDEIPVADAVSGQTLTVVDVDGNTVTGRLSVKPRMSDDTWRLLLKNETDRAHQLVFVHPTASALVGAPGSATADVVKAEGPRAQLPGA